MARPTTRLGLVVALGLVFLAIFLLKAKNEMADFEVNYKAGHRLAMGETLYRTSDSHWQFKYSPFSAFLYLPLSFLPLPVAKGLWYVLILASMGCIFVLTTGMASSLSRLSPFGPALLAVVVLAKYLLRELQLGQINALITAILTAMIWLLVRDDPVSSRRRACLAGLLWGLATALKPYAVIFLPYFALKKKGRLLAAGFLTIAVTLIIPAGFYGFRGCIAVIGEWGSTLARSTPLLYASQDNVSLLGFFVKWTNHIVLSYILYAVSVALLALLTLLTIFRGKRLSKPNLLEGALLLLLIPLISPLGWDYTFLSSYPAIVLIFIGWRAFPKPARVLLAVNFAIIALSLYDLIGRKFYTAFMSWSILTIDFLVVAGALIMLRWKRTA
jgi:hypothetical protein